MSDQMKLFETVSQSADIRQVQEYLRKVMTLRGFDGQSAQDKMLLLTEEIGELAKALRKSEGVIAVDRSKIQNYDTVESEIADVFVVLISLCNVLDVDLYEAFLDKEKVNLQRVWSSGKGEVSGETID